MEVGQQDVRVTSIEPGLIRTELGGSSYGSVSDYYANLPFEPLQAEDVARAVFYAVSRPEHALMVALPVSANAVLFISGVRAKRRAATVVAALADWLSSFYSSLLIQYVNDHAPM
jgi:short-subunit dehydrogenase